MTSEPAPLPPVAPYFDADCDAWILSRYQDVLTAFREPRLWTIAQSGSDQMEVRDDSGRLAARGAMQEVLSHPKVAEWRQQFEPEVLRVLAGLPRDRPADLLREFSQPCCLFLAVRITGANPADSVRLSELSAIAFGGTGSEKGSLTRARAAAASEELNRYFEQSPFRMGEPTFVGTAQTMARLLTSGFLALLRHPAEYQRLRLEPELMPTAVEELLRFAGIVPTLYRRASAALEIGGAQIGEGQRVNLKIASANRDPEQFPAPDRLDIARRAVNHLSLGIGRNSCVGNLVIRMASTVMTGALVREFPQGRLAGEVPWRSSPSFSWPDAVPMSAG